MRLPNLNTLIIIQHSLRSHKISWDLICHLSIVIRNLSRVAKCHGYDGYIRIKILASWGKSLGGQTILQNEAFLEEICSIYLTFLCLNNPTLTESSTSVLQKYP